MKGLLSMLLIDADSYKQIKDDVWTENWKYYRVFSLVALLAFLAMSSVSPVIPNLKNRHMNYVVYFFICLLLYSLSFSRPKQRWVQAAAVYALDIVVLSFGIVLGVWLSRNELSVSFIVFLLTVPLLFTTRPLATNAIIAAAIAVFSVSSYLVHPRSIFIGNLINVLIFGIVGMVVSLLITRIKMEKFLYQKQNVVLEQKNQAANARLNAVEAFINDMVRFVSSEDDPHNVLEQLLQFLGENLDADRAYIAEKNAEDTFDNTYEWCREGIVPKKDDRQGLPYEGTIDVWYRQFNRSKNVIIRDSEQYKKISQQIYDILKAQGVSSMVLSPIRIDGKIIGFYGVDNPPPESIDQISKLIGMADSIISMMIRLRNNADALEQSATHDQLTGCKNRKALEWVYFVSDVSMAVMECDLNGLKDVNDRLGHMAGDGFILRVAGTLKSVFGAENVYRMGGDEFLAVVTGMDEAEFQAKAVQARTQLGSAASIGFAYCPNSDKDFDSLLKEADAKMYADKKRYYREHGIERRKNRVETAEEAAAETL